MRRLLIAITLLLAIQIQAKQVVDTEFTPKNQYKISQSKVVLIDAAHHNFHRLTGRYQPFAKVLKSAGFSVKSNAKKFSEESLSNIDVLVVANALNERNIKNHDLPNFAAFSQQEIETVHQWVKNGGSLMLIADHMPWPKASQNLAASFGFQFSNSYVEVLDSPEQYFEQADGSLIDHEILKKTAHGQRITKVRGFMGQAFLSPPQAKPILVFTKKSVAYMPSKAWQINDDTPTISATGWHQGATLNFHQGRVAVFGEAGMFTAQIGSNEKEQWNMGMNAKGAEQNEQFLLNTIMWLAKTK